MRQTLLFLIVLILTACSSQEKDPRIEKFENYLGKEKSAVLTTKVESFESFLAQNFNNRTIEEDYIEFLKIIALGEEDKIDWEVERTNRKELEQEFELSRLRQEIWNKPDSVWISDTVLICMSFYIDNSDTIEIVRKNYQPKYRNINLNLDSIKLAEKNILNFNQNGKYYKGLEMVKDSDSTIIIYNDFRSAYGGISTDLFADILLSRKTDYSDYFVKRIIMIELYREIRLPTSPNSI